MAWYLTKSNTIERPPAITIIAVLSFAVAIGLPVGLVATYPTEDQAGFGPVIEWIIYSITLPVSAWVTLLALALYSNHVWSRWPLTFTLYMLAGTAARQLLVGGPRDGNFLTVVGLLFAATVLAGILLLLPSTDRYLKRHHSCR